MQDPHYASVCRFGSTTMRLKRKLVLQQAVHHGVYMLSGGVCKPSESFRRFRHSQATHLELESVVIIIIIIAGY